MWYYNNIISIYNVLLHQISVNLENFRFWDNYQKNYDEQKFGKINFKTVISTWKCNSVPSFSQFGELESLGPNLPQKTL